MDLLPWNEIVRQSYALAFLGIHIDPSWDTSKLEELVNHTLPSQSKGYPAQWVEAFVEITHNKSTNPLMPFFQVQRLTQMRTSSKWQLWAPSI